MDEPKKRLIVFFLGLILSFIYWRLRVLFFYSGGSVSIIRAVTGLTIHHYHFGIIILTFFLLLYLFYEQNNLFVGLIGFGLGSILDSFISRLFKSNTRIEEIINYNANFYNTFFVFGIVIVLGLIFYLMSKTLKVLEHPIRKKHSQKA